MASKKTLCFVFALLVQIFDCDGKNKDDVISEFEFFKQTVLNGRETRLDDVMTNLLESFTTVTHIDTITRDLVPSVEHIPELTILKIELVDLSVLFDKVDYGYDSYITHRESGKDANDPSLRKFSEVSRNPYQGPIDYLNTIYSKVVPRNLDVSSIDLDYTNDGSVLSLLTKHMQGYKMICNKHKSQQQIFHMLYTSLGVAEMKVYSILEFCFKKLSEIGQCNYNEEIKLLKDRFRVRSDKSLIIFKRLMSIASRDYWRCDPKNHVEDKTYTELKEVFQKYIIKNKNMNKENNCEKRCGNYHSASVTGCANDEDYYDSETNYYAKPICTQQSKCNGRLYDCEDYFFKFEEIWICPSPYNSTRRYEFIKHGLIDNRLSKYEMMHYGHKGEKKDCKQHLSYDYREFDGLCQICLCTCDNFQSSTSENIFNIRPIKADNDYVITGAKLVKEDRTLHIQIEQGKILANGQIDEKTLHWKDINRTKDYGERVVLSWNQVRTIYLGVTEVPKDHVMIGLQFKIIQRGTDRQVEFESTSVPYDFKNGKLDYTGLYTDPRPDFDSNPLPADSEVDLNDCDASSHTDEPSVAQPESKKFVKFTTSNFKKDLGQSMIPFFDIQEVQIRPPVPLTGAGFYHKNTRGYGGFLGVKLNTYDFSSHL